MPLEKRASVDPMTCASLEVIAERMRTLEDVVRWGLSQEPRALIESVVTQDEYTHDVVMPYRNKLYLVFDTT